jgi:hypothetical protein
VTSRLTVERAETYDLLRHDAALCRMPGSRPPTMDCNSPCAINR